MRETKYFKDSSRVTRGWYDHHTETIEVEFVDGVHWLYRNSSKFEWDDLRRAVSPGLYIAEHLNSKPNGPR